MLRLSVCCTETALKQIKVQLTAPFIEFNESVKYSFTKECKEILQEMESYILFFGEIKPEAESLYEKYLSIHEAASIQIQDFKLDSLPYEERQKMSNKITLIQESLAATLDLIAFIKNILVKRESDIESLMSEMELPDAGNDLVRICHETSGKRFDSDPVNVSWKYCKERKVQSLGEVRRRKAESIRNKEQVDKVSSD